VSKERERDGLRPAQVVAGALAAVTAAFIGAQIGVYGTVIGAGLLSLGTTIGSELYLRSLERTKEAAKRTKHAALAKVAGRVYVRGRDDERTQALPEQRRWGQDGTRVMPARHEDERTRVLARQQGAAQDGTKVLPAQQQWAHDSTRVMRPGQSADPDPTRRMGAQGDVVDPDAPTVYLPRVSDDTTDADEADETSKPRRRVRWGVVIGGSVAAFVLGMAVITGIEMLTGNTLSGEQGRTITNVLGGQPDGDDQQERPAPQKTEESGTPEAPPEQDESTEDEQEPQSPEVPQNPQQPQPPATSEPPASSAPAPPSTPQEQPEEELPPQQGQNERPAQQQPPAE
jgi:hypothetical protein